jgi:hypothetical protein
MAEEERHQPLQTPEQYPQKCRIVLPDQILPEDFATVRISGRGHVSRQIKNRDRFKITNDIQRDCDRRLVTHLLLLLLSSLLLRKLSFYFKFGDSAVALVGS